LKGFRQEIFRISGKDVDDGSKKILAGSLSLIGRLFEIYFVRLIGTPNQNSKNGISFGWCRV
jgi:hypothetical protein